MPDDLADEPEAAPEVETAPDPGSETARRMSADRLAELEEERRFLLRSISDLDLERGAGDVDDADYTALRDGYTARAAAVLRAIDEGRSAFKQKVPRDWKRIIGIAAVVVAFGVVAGILVARYSGQRDSGDVITGGTSPDQVSTLLSEGRQLYIEGATAEASNRFLSVLDIDPKNAEARAYAGWILVGSSRSMVGDVAAKTLEDGKTFLEQAITDDSTYADPHCFLALTAGVYEHDVATALAREKECRALNPSSDMQGLMVEFVDPLTTAPSASDSAPADAP